MQLQTNKVCGKRITTARRDYRRVTANLARLGHGILRVLASDSGKFRLGLEHGVRIVILGPVDGFPKQGDAIAYGEKHYGRKAIKVAAYRLVA